MNQPVKILHIFDDEKISQPTINLFRKLLGYDQTFIVIAAKEEKWSNIFQANNSFRLLPHTPDLNSRLRHLIGEYDIIFLQALSFEKARAISSRKFDGKVFIWGLWGYELYNIFSYFNPRKNQNFSTIGNKKNNIISKIRDFYTFNIIYKKAVKKIDICLFLLEQDFKLLSDSLDHNAVWMTACYQTVENMYGRRRDFTIRGDSILIGNSSTSSNRHEYVFGLLEGADTGNRRIIVPLSYGDPEYRNEVIKSGENIFKKQLRPLIDFMDLETYLEEIKTVSHVIMAHERQQGFGSIVMMLMGGAKVFLSESSPLYDWLKELGVFVFCVESDTAWRTG